MYGTGKVTIFSIFLAWFEIVSTYFCIFLRHSIPSTSQWYWTFLMELDPLVDVEDQLTLVLSLQKSGDVCIYLGTGCRYISLIWGLSILELGFLFQSSNDHVGSVPSRFAIGVKPECSGICIPPWHAQTNPRFGSHVYSRLVVKPKKTWFKDLTCTTTSTTTCNVVSFLVYAQHTIETHETIHHQETVCVSGHRPHQFQEDVEDFRSLLQEALLGQSGVFWLGNKHLC